MNKIYDYAIKYSLMNKTFHIIFYENYNKNSIFKKIRKFSDRIYLCSSSLIINQNNMEKFFPTLNVITYQH